MSRLLIVAGTLIAIPGAVVALQYGILTLASLLYRQPRADNPPRLRFLVLIPAHNEEVVIGATVAAVGMAMRDGDAILVVDDRSEDLTGPIAAGLGASVLRREPGSEPGRAAARQAGIRHALGLAGWDVLAMIDADSQVERGYFEACEAVLATGALAVQARSEAMPGPGLVAQSSVAAFALQGVTIPRGRDRLGLSVRLKGTGMVLRRQLLERFSFRGPGAGEDLWFSNDLLLAGIVARHVDTARLRSDSAASLEVAATQRVRWEAGRLLAAREFVWPLLRRHDLPSLEAALHLLTVPYSQALLSLLAGAVLLLLGGALLPAALGSALLLMLAGDLAVALLQVHARRRTWTALLIAPAYVVWKVWVQLRALVIVFAGNRAFPGTRREPARSN